MVNTSWVYNLRKESLTEELRNRNLATEGTVKELRRRLIEYIKYQPSEMGDTEESEEVMISDVANDNISNYVSNTTSTQLSTQTIPTMTTFTMPTITTVMSSSTSNYGLYTNVSTHVPTSTILPPMFTWPGYQAMSAVSMPYNMMSPYIHPSYFQTSSSLPTVHPVSTYQPIVPPNQQSQECVPTENQQSKSIHKQELYSDAEIMDKVRKWGVKFDQGHDALNFIERVEELAECYQIAKDRLLKALPELLIKNALVWYRNNKHNWHDWDGFIKDFKNFFLPPRYNIKLNDDIRNRTQKSGESVRNYVNAIQALQRWQVGTSAEEKLERIYENLLPDYRLYIRPRDFTTLSELINAAEEYEKVKNENRILQQKNKIAIENNRQRVVKPVNVYPVNSIVCWRCGEEGHLKRECKKKWCQRCRSLQCKCKTEEKIRDDGNTRQPDIPEYKASTELQYLEEITILNHKFTALIDTGACFTFMGEELRKLLKANNYESYRCKINTSMADGQRAIINEYFNVELVWEGNNIKHRIYYLPKLTEQIIIGMDFLHKMKTKLIIAGKEIKIQPKQEIALKVTKIKTTINQEKDMQQFLKEPLQRNETKDTWYTRKLKEVTEYPEKQPDYKIQNGKLFRHFHGCNVEDTGPEWKLCINKNEIQEVLKENHDDKTAGHLGTRKTIARIAKYYYWPGMFREITKYVQSCKTCAEFKPIQQLPAGKMHGTLTSRPWQVISSDFIGPLPRSKKGNTMILVFHDKFTKWTEFIACREATTTILIKHFKERIFAHHGCPETFISDNGHQYTSHKFQNLLKNLRIRHQFTPPYTPHANPTERMNRTIKTMIAQYIKKDQREWDEHIPELMLALNTSRHESTGYTATYLNFGREVVLPSLFHQSQNATEEDDPDFKKLKEVYDLVKLNLSKAFTQQSRHYNLRTREWLPKPGEYVMKKKRVLSSKIQNFNAKLGQRYSGPYQVVEIISPVIVGIKTKEGTKLEKVHVKDLKIFQQRSESSFKNLEK